MPSTTPDTTIRFHFVYPQGAVPTLVLTAAQTRDGVSYVAEAHTFAYPNKTASARLTHTVDAEKPGTLTSLDQMLTAALHHAATVLNPPTEGGSTFGHWSPLALQEAELADVRAWRRAGHIHGMAGVAKRTTLAAVRELLEGLVATQGAKVEPLA